MPDPENKTISATESPALFGVSPYFTRWQLWHKFASGRSLDRGVDPRMDWGKKMQPLILEQVAHEMKLEVIPNEEKYVRRGLLGCTRDATIIAPDRGPGALEIKCVFSYDVWMQQWNGGKSVPRHYEIQLQQQMLVGDIDKSLGGGPPYGWGLIVAWVCADLHYFERKPIRELWTTLNAEAGLLFASVAANKEPDPFGSPMELSWMSKLFPTIKDSVLDLSADPAHVKTAEDVDMYQFHKVNEIGGKHSAEQIKAKLLAIAKGNEKVLLPCGYSFNVRKIGAKGQMIVPYVPSVKLAPPPMFDDTIIGAG